MGKRKIVLKQLASSPLAKSPGVQYEVVQMSNTVQFSIGDRLGKADVDHLLSKSYMEVVIK
jgi:hypothetical protein